MRPKITIAIPTYERMRYIKGALESALSQNYENFEVLICDTSFHDQIKELAASYNSGNLRYIKESPEMEMSLKLNYLLQKAAGNWMLFLCDDDLLEPDYLEVMARRIEDNPDATLIRCKYRLIDEEGRLIRLDEDCKEIMSGAEILSRIFLPEKHFFKMNLSGILFPRKLLIKIGGIERLPLSWHSDRLAWAALAAEGYGVFEAKPLCNIRLHAGSITSSSSTNLDTALEADKRAGFMFEEIIDKRLRRTSSEEERLYLMKAKKHLEDYMMRHLSRSFDRSFLSYFLSEKASPEQTKFLFDKMKELKIGSFRSLRFYHVLSMFPDWLYWLRDPMLQAFRHYKIRKWCV